MKFIALSKFKFTFANLNFVQKFRDMEEFWEKHDKILENFYEKSAENAGYILCTIIREIFG